MTKIFVNGRLEDQEWIRLEADQQVPGTGNIVVPLERYLEDESVRSGIGRTVAVLVTAGEDVAKLDGYLDTLSVVAVEFPKFTDGRGFSAARILREHLSYRGDIRAVGDYILDQVPFMRRCGVSSFELTRPEVLKALSDGEWPEVTKYLQPVGSVDEVPEGTRPWARRSLREVAVAAE